MNVAVSKKGMHTRGQIVSSARILFYEKGYENTSVKDICESAGVKAGTLTYYFKTKYDLVRELYETAFRRSYEFVENNLDRAMNSLEKNTVVAFVYFHAILADANTRRFHLEILERSSVGDYISQVALPISQQFIKDFKLNFSTQELLDIDMAENGLSRELFINFLDNANGRTVQDLVNTIYIFRARLFTVDENIMKAYLFSGLNFDRTFDHSHITLLG